VSKLPDAGTVRVEAAPRSAGGAADLAQVLPHSD
jgi:hypothetical protein